VPDGGRRIRRSSPDPRLDALRTRAAAAQLDSVSTIRVWFSSSSALKRTARNFSAAGTLDLERENCGLL
jgi:hypothetical protein